jgi:F0F1-type ATP synthase membrane subunit b/b'
MSDNSSDKKPNWVDYANLASNVAQNIQLSQLHSTLSALASLQAERALQEQNQQQAMERENRLREFIWRLEVAFDAYLRNAGATPSGRLAVAKQMIAGLAQGGVTTASFSQFVDKDRLGRFFYRLQQTTEEAGRILSEREKRDAEAYLRYESEAQDLDALIKRGTEKQTEISYKLSEAKKRKGTATKRLEELRAQASTAAQVTLPEAPSRRRILAAAWSVGAGILALILFLVGALAGLVGVFAIGVFIYSLVERSPGDIGFFVGFGIGLLVIAFVCFAVAGMLVPKSPVEKPIEERIAELEKQIASADARISELKAQRSPDGEFRKFNATTLSGLLKEREIRTDFRLQFRQDHSL